MGFGFFGKAPGVIDFTANGMNNGVNRYFGVSSAVSRPINSAVFTGNKYRIDYDVDGQGAPSTIKFDAAAESAYAVNKIFNSSELLGAATNNFSVEAALNTYVVPLAGTYNSGGTTRYAYYAGTAVLSPATRRVKLTEYRPDLITYISWFESNNSGNNAASNSRQGADNTYYQAFPNLKGIRFRELYISAINKRLPSKLEYIDIGETSNLSAIAYPLPASVKTCVLAAISNTLAGGINTLLSEAVNMETLFFANPSPYPTTIANQTNGMTGTLDLDHMTNLKELIIPQNSITALSLAPNISTLRLYHVAGCTGLNTVGYKSMLDDILVDNTGLQVFNINLCQLTWTKAIGDSTLPTSLAIYYGYGNSITGNISITTSRSNMRYFKTGDTNYRVGAQQNSHPTVDITGLTNAHIIDLTGSDVDNLTLPVNTVCQQLYLFDNELDATVNTNLVSQINAMTGLVTVYLGSNSASNSEAAVRGQSSTNGFGNNLSLSGLINATSISVSSCKLTGTLTLPNVNKLTSLFLSFNHNLSAIANLTSHTGLLSITTYNCENLSFAITNAFTAINQILVSDTGITAIDLTGKTTGSMNELQCSNCDSLTTITFSATSARMIFGSPRTITGANSATLSSIVNMDQVSFNAKTFGINTWAFENCVLDVTFPFGANDFCPNAITIQNNAMSQANVDATITSLYDNKTKWATYTIAKTMNIAGTNAAPTGTYQAPAGFVLGVSDGTPASVKEMVYVLVNNYSWTITMN